VPPQAAKQTSIVFGAAGFVALLAGASGFMRMSFAVVLFVVSLILAGIVMMSGKAKN
jgi:hypothetical protein